jgi:hypothetical protein
MKPVSAEALTAIMLFTSLPLTALGLLYKTTADRRYALRSILLAVAALVFWLTEAILVLRTSNMVPVEDNRDRLMVAADFLLVLFVTLLSFVLAVRARRQAGWRGATIAAVGLSAITAGIAVAFSTLGIVFLVGVVFFRWCR